MNTGLKVTGMALGALLTFAGCGGSSGSTSSNDNSTNSTSAPSGTETGQEKVLYFYNHLTDQQYSFDTSTGKATNQNTAINNDYNTAENNDDTLRSYIDMAGKDDGRLIYWLDDEDEKIVMVKASYNYATDGNLTYDDFYYLAHFHGTEIAAHSNEEFSPDSNETETIKAKKAAALARLNVHLAEQEEIKAEISEALVNLGSGETLCNFFVPEHHHEDEEEGHEEEATTHYALTNTGKVYFFQENNSSLELFQNTAVHLTGASSCVATESGITSSSEHGVYIFLKETQTLYLVDEHGEDYHEHSKWKLTEFMPSSFEATQMVSLNIGDAEDDHDHEDE